MNKDLIELGRIVVDNTGIINNAAKENERIYKRILDERDRVKSVNEDLEYKVTKKRTNDFTTHRRTQK